jgi:hypothetical protein
MGMYEKKVASIVSVVLLVVVFAMIVLTDAGFYKSIPTSFSEEHSDLLSNGHHVNHEG